MEKKYTILDLEHLIVDLCDGSLVSWYEIKDHTGLSEERCKEMEEMIKNILAKW